MGHCAMLTKWIRVHAQGYPQLSLKPVSLLQFHHQTSPHHLWTLLCNCLVEQDSKKLPFIILLCDKLGHNAWISQISVAKSV